MIILETNLGAIKIELDEKNTPKTAANFLRYVKEGFYDNTIFHRVIRSFMVQGGGFEAGMHHKANHEPIENEADKGQSNQRGTVAMARTSDPHSATSQFFINTKDNTFLNYKRKDGDGWGYCVFGKVIAGMDVVDKIEAVETTSKAGHQDVPVEDIVVQKVVVAETQ